MLSILENSKLEVEESIQKQAILIVPPRNNRTLTYSDATKSQSDATNGSVV